jgi:hypothetical protein
MSGSKPRGATSWREQELRRKKFWAELLAAPQGDAVDDELYHRLKGLFFDYRRARRSAHMVLDLFELFVIFLDKDTALTLFEMCDGKRARERGRSALLTLLETRKKYRGETEADVVRKIIEIDGRHPEGLINAPKRGASEASLRHYIDEARGELSGKKKIRP